jgi:hypothetical protein
VTESPGASQGGVGDRPVAPRQELLSAQRAKRELLARLLQERSRAGWVSLSYGQRVLWDLEQQAAPAAVNTEAFVLRLGGPLDLPGLQEAYQEVVSRHPCLRATFSSNGSEPAQRFHDAGGPVVEMINGEDWSQEELSQRVSDDAHARWDLEHGPVFGVHLYRRSATESVVLTRIHHLAIDLWSMGVLLEDFQHFYLARQLRVAAQLPPLPAHYRDFVRWQQELVKGPEGERQLAYWQKQLAGAPAGLNLTGDQAHLAVPSYQGATLPVHLDRELSQRLRELARQEQATVFMILLAGLSVLLGRVAKQEDVLVGTRVAARSRPEFERLVGCFTNPVALRADLSGNPSFRSVLRRVRQTVLDGLMYQDYPFSLLCEQLPAPAVGRPPLGNVVFVLQKPLRFGGAQQEGVQSFGISSQARMGGEVAVGSKRFEIFPVELRVARQDLELEMVEMACGILGWLRYRVDLFTQEQVADLVRGFVGVLEAVISAPETRLGDLPAG